MVYKVYELLPYLRTGFIIQGSYLTPELWLGAVQSFITIFGRTATPNFFVKIGSAIKWKNV